MADQDEQETQTAPALADIARVFLAQTLDPGNMLKIQQLILTTKIESEKDAEEFAWKIVGLIIAKAAETIFNVMRGAEPALDEISKTAIDGLFGEGGVRGGQSRDMAHGAAAKLLTSLTGNASTIEPSDEPARHYLEVVTHLAIEGWLQGWLFEFAADICPGVDALEKFGDLKDIIAEVMGLGRLSRRVLGPYIQTTVVTPTEWKVNKTYRPTLLGAGDVVRQLSRGRWSKDRAFEELARQGLSDDRIEAVLNGVARFVSAADAMVLYRNDMWSQERVIQNLKDQGFDGDTAQLTFAAADAQRLQQLHDDSLAAVRRAFADREISDAEFSNFLQAILPHDADRAAEEVAAGTIREMNRKFLSSSDAEAAVKLGILAVSDYRQTLEREGYTDDAVLIKELILRSQIDREHTLEEHRAQADAERAAEKQARADAAAKRLADLEAQRALARRGSLAELQRAAVRGLIPFARLAEVLAPQYDADTVSIILSGVELDRQNYLAQQQAAADAKKRAEERQIDVGALQQAVLAGMLTLIEFRARLDSLKFTPADADLLTATLAARKADLDDAQQKRRDAEAAAKNKAIDLGRFEQLVRRGVRTLADYDALLSSLGFGDAARAAMADLLNLKIADDAHAQQLRDELAAKDKAKGLTLEQFRRAVILGVTPIESFDVFLTTQGFTPEAHAVLMAELRDDVTQADAARRKREAAAAQTDPRVLPFATLERAARLGIISPATYQARLAALRFTPDDIAIELDLLVMEIADVQAARQKQQQQDKQATDRGLSLVQLANAVKLGEASVDDYRVRAIELGYAADDVAVLVNVLLDELAAHAAAQQQRPTVLSAAAAGGVSLDALEAQVKQGSLTGAEFVAALTRAGVSPDQAELAAAPLLIG